MCHSNCIDFGKTCLKEEYIRGKTIIEVGSYEVNGSLRSTVEAFGPNHYIGVDIQMGPGVDQICKAEELINKFGKNKFDLLICTELLEHVLNWGKVIHNLKQIIKPEGVLLITTRSKGFGYHGYPFDFWRYEIADMEVMFKDFEIEVLKKDPGEGCPGVFLLARKPKNFQEIKSSRHRLFSIILEKTSSIMWISIYWPVWRFCKLTKADRCAYYILHPWEVPAMIRRKLSGEIR